MKWVGDVGDAGGVKSTTGVRQPALADYGGVHEKEGRWWPGLHSCLLGLGLLGRGKSGLLNGGWWRADAPMAWSPGPSGTGLARTSQLAACWPAGRPSLEMSPSEQDPALDRTCQNPQAWAQPPSTSSSD